MAPLRLVVLGLSLSSSWGNGHATTWRALLKAFAARGHAVTFLEREQSWYAATRDLVDPLYCDLVFYDSLDGLARHRAEIAAADAVIVGSFVPDGIAVARFVLAHAHGRVAFYDIDTPVTLAGLVRGDLGYLCADLVPRFDLYLSFTGGPTLARLERTFDARRARPLYCAVDAELYRPLAVPKRYDLGYLGTYSPDRQPLLERLLIEPARRRPDRRFVVAGPLYPPDIDWPRNVTRLDHVAPADHAAFYGALRATLNLTRADMVAAGFSPSVRLFEAAACGTAIVSDAWPGLDELFAPGQDILLAHGTADVLGMLDLDDAALAAVGAGARRRVLAGHTAAHRAAELEQALRADLRVRASAPTPA